MVTELTTLAACKLTAQAIASMYKGAKTISDVFLARKIEKFAEEPFSEKSLLYINNLDAQKFERLQEQLIHALTHAETAVKALYVKNLTEAHCRGDIDWLTFCRMNHILRQIFTFDLKPLAMFYNHERPENIEDEITQNKLNFFAQLGLVDYTNILDGSGKEPMFEPNEFGKKFIKCAIPDLDLASKNRADAQFKEQWGDFMDFE